MSHIQPDTTLPKTKSIKIYTAIIDQGSTEAPVATVLHNTLGNVTWERLSEGLYLCTIPEPLMTSVNQSIWTSDQSVSKKITTGYYQNNQVYLQQTNLASPWAVVDGLEAVYFELRIYDL